MRRIRQQRTKFPKAPCDESASADPTGSAVDFNAVGVEHQMRGIIAPREVINARFISHCARGGHTADGEGRTTSQAIDIRYGIVPLPVQQTLLKCCANIGRQTGRAA